MLTLRKTDSSYSKPKKSSGDRIGNESLMDYRFCNTLPAAPDDFKLVASVNPFVSMAI